MQVNRSGIISARQPNFIGGRLVSRQIGTDVRRIKRQGKDNVRSGMRSQGPNDLKRISLADCKATSDQL